MRLLYSADFCIIVGMNVNKEGFINEECDICIKAVTQVDFFEDKKYW